MPYLNTEHDTLTAAQQAAFVSASALLRDLRGLRSLAVDVGNALECGVSDDLNDLIGSIIAAMEAAGIEAPRDPRQMAMDFKAKLQAQAEARRAAA
jgi:hypothetical protein